MMMCKNQKMKNVIIDGMDNPTIVNPLPISANPGQKDSPKDNISSPTLLSID